MQLKNLSDRMRYQLWSECVCVCVCVCVQRKIILSVHKSILIGIQNYMYKNMYVYVYIETVIAKKKKDGDAGD